jgi:transcriptional regulator GlxA family with amidase domain
MKGRLHKDRLRVIDVTVVLLEAGYASTAIVPIEVFHSAGVLWNWLHAKVQQPRFRVRIASIDGKAVTSLCSLGLMPQFALKQIKRTDIIILPASGWDIQERIARNSGLIPWLRKWHARGADIAGICTGVAFLAESGILDGKEATTHWAVAEVLRARYPKVNWRPEQFLTEEKGVFCSGGVYASIDLSLYLVEKYCGHEVALQCARSLVVSMPRRQQSGYAVVSLARPHGDAQIRQAEVYLQQHFADGHSMEEVARRVGMSGRNFIRRFKAATGRLPGEYVQTLRMSSAREMIERGGIPIQRVCTKVGYEDLAFFRRIFRRHTGMTPTQYRERFGATSFDRPELASGGT